MRAMIAQDLVRTADFPKERRIGDYGRLRKIRCESKGLARACALYETSGLDLAIVESVIRDRLDDLLTFAETVRPSLAADDND